MNVGILTFNRAVNYGAVFQTYALECALLDLGVNVYVIDYHCIKLEEVYENVIHWNIPPKALWDILLYRKRKDKKKNFDRFSNEYIKPIPLSEAGKMDVLITGSDQVWNCEITGNDMVYFLDTFRSDIKRISYAACTGRDNYSIELKNKIVKALSGFSRVSVRDSESYDVISKYFKGSIEKVPDPTLLIKKECWNDAIHSVKYKNYVLVFAVGFSECLSDFAHDLAEKKKKLIIFINSNLRKKGKGIYLDTASPDKVLGLIDNADYIVTNSFHGTAMSIAFEKEFFVELNHDKKGRNHRVESLLEDVEVEGREIVDSVYMGNSFTPINWEKVRLKKECLREKGINFLKDSLK
jgi:hypothetical protein